MEVPKMMALAANMMTAMGMSVMIAGDATR